MNATPASSGHWMVGSDGVGWFFDSGALCLDFGYTGDFGYGVDAWEQLRRPADLAAWLGERFAASDVECNDEEFVHALRLRAAIWRFARGASAGNGFEPRDIDAVNHAAQHCGVVPLLVGGTRPPPSHSAAMMLATIAQDAVAVFGSDVERVRECAADDCHLIFFDSSRAGSRRWCSMKRCGNRQKARTYARTVIADLHKEQS